mmetsp:Transcript_16585/g.36693  ORF Transcript_16585/g.36693 Transcript_16585/m.36693 type:complete len:550 (-) Transcript_16585:172-1821(-)|eukprot:CAMPEP_0204277120 /NCGR_PEP_ID=MMETSP0468-20130131/29112_1 /ASSEMBLY_ACC=CAM_ASM_000383 /TAXON_ID=2969 /ORGANISM="Oxyrrhis marina" /LENGTH=549 /DNA_ID=CAMNT_0051253845 /DNA_START=167 /DNA_END=1816 /DNA_ORIENTATION=-
MSAFTTTVALMAGAAAQATVTAGSQDMQMTIQAGDLSSFESTDYGVWADGMLIVALVAGYFFVQTRRSKAAISAKVMQKAALIEHDSDETPALPRLRKASSPREQSPTQTTPTKRPRPTAATDTCRKLNQAICASESAEQVLALVASSGHQMNAVNLSTAMHRVARWTKKSQLDVDEVRSSAPWKKLVRLSHQRVADVTVQGISNMLWAAGVLRVDVEQDAQFMAALAETASKHATEHTPQALANIVWTCAVLQWRNVELLTQMRSAAVASIKEFNPQDLSNIAWALGTVRFLDSAFLQAMTKVAIPMLGACKPAELSNIVWACASAGYLNRELMERASDVVCAGPEAFTSQSVSNVAWSFATLGFNDERLMSSITRVAVAKMRWFSPSELSNLLWACATLNVGGPRVLDAACTTIIRSHDRFSGDDLSNTVWALATLKFGSSVACDHLVRACAARRSEMSAKAMTNVLWGFATLGYKGACSLFVNWAGVIVERNAEFTPTELVTVAWGYANSGVRVPELLACIAKEVQGKLNQDEEQALKLAFQKLSF